VSDVVPYDRLMMMQICNEVVRDNPELAHAANYLKFLPAPDGVTTTLRDNMTVWYNAEWVVKDRKNTTLAVKVQLTRTADVIGG